MNPAGLRSLKKISDYRFYVDSLTPFQIHLLAARYLRKVPTRYRSLIYRTATVQQLAFCEVFSKETYGW